MKFAVMKFTVMKFAYGEDPLYTLAKLQKFSVVAWLPKRPKHTKIQIPVPA